MEPWPPALLLFDRERKEERKREKVYIYSDVTHTRTHNFLCEPEQERTLKYKNIKENTRTCFHLWVCTLCRGCSLRDLTNNRMHTLLQRANLHLAIKRDLCCKNAASSCLSQNHLKATSARTISHNSSFKRNKQALFF